MFLNNPLPPTLNMDPTPLTNSLDHFSPDFLSLSSLTNSSALKHLNKVMINVNTSPQFPLPINTFTYIYTYLFLFSVSAAYKQSTSTDLALNKAGKPPKSFA